MLEFKAGDKVKIEDAQYDANPWLLKETGISKGQVLTIIGNDPDNILIKEDKRNIGKEYMCGWSSFWFKLVKVNQKIKIKELF